MRSLKSSEQGQTLILAIVFLTAIAVMISALLFQAFGGFAATTSFKSVLATQYDADAAVQEAINGLASPSNFGAPLPIPVAPNAPLTQLCPSNSAPGDSNPVTADGPAVYAYCTYLSDSYLVRDAIVNACSTNLTYGITGTSTAGSTTVALGAVGVGGPSPSVGEALNGADLPQGAYITALGNGGTTAVLSQAATGSGSNLSWTYTAPPSACARPLIRASVEISESGPSSGLTTVRILDWSDLYASTN